MALTKHHGDKDVKQLGLSYIAAMTVAEPIDAQSLKQQLYF